MPSLLISLPAALLPELCVFALLLLLWLGGMALSWYVDPARIFRRRNELRPARKLRERKLKSLRDFPQPVGTLVLGTSRVFNLDLSTAASGADEAGDGGIPAPVFNFAVDGGMSEDWLAGWRWAVKLNAEKGGPPPRLLVIGVGLPSFHPSKPLPWEALVERDFGAEAVAIGALPAGEAWRWTMLPRPDTLRHTLRYLQQRARRRREGYKAKFDYGADGVLHWYDDASTLDRPALLERQMRSYPRTGLLLKGYTRIGEKRAQWFETLLADCSAAGCGVCVCIVPEHPAMLEREREIGAAPVHRMVGEYLARVCAQHGALYFDWLDPAPLGLGPQDFRDVMHFTESGAHKLAAALMAELSASRKTVRVIQ